MRTKVARRHQITIPEEIRKKAKISVGDSLEISYSHGKVLVEKVDENWEYVMKETKGIRRKHPAFKDMDDAVEIVNWIRRDKKTLKRILPDFLIGAHAEKYSDALITWNPADYKIDIPVITPVDVMEKEI